MWPRTGRVFRVGLRRSPWPSGLGRLLVLRSSGTIASGPCKDSEAEQGLFHRLLAMRAWRVHTSDMGESLTLTAVFTPDENGWTMAQLAEWPAVVTCAPTLEEARDMLLDAAHEMVASYRSEGREPPIGGGRVESLKIDLAA